MEVGTNPQPGGHGAIQQIGMATRSLYGSYTICVLDGSKVTSG